MRVDRKNSVTWLALVVATCVSSAFVEGYSVKQIAVPVALMFAWFKIRMVVLHFMELRDAPIGWRLLLEGWIMLVTAIVLTSYVLTPTSL